MSEAAKNTSAQDEWLKSAFENWDAGEPGTSVRESLDASLFEDTWLNRAFGKWDAGEPSVAAWESVGESLSVESVWNRVGQSLTEEDHRPDAWIAAAHSTWNPAQEHDGWQKLSDAISIEQVWKDIDRTLDRPVRTRIPVWKLAAASVAALFAVQHFSDSPITEHYTAASTGFIPQEQLIDSSVNSGASLIHDGTASTADAATFIASQQQDERQQNNQQHAPEQNVAVVTPQNDLPQNNEEITGNGQHTASEAPADNMAASNTGIPDELADEPMNVLEQRALSSPAEGLQPTAAVFPVRQMPFANWTVQLGTQLSVLHERDQAMLTSTVPGLGLAADVSYRHRLDRVQFIHALGMSQYSQGAGKYINGRYFNTNQRINTLQFSSSVGYSYKRFTFYGGLLVSKVLSGLEQKNNAVTKVYDFTEVQTGFTGGIDYRLASLRNGKYFSLGSQYQWLPSFSGQKGSFANIQGIRFQAKISF